MTVDEAVEATLMLARAFNGGFQRGIKETTIKEYCGKHICSKCILKGQYDDNPEHCIPITEASEEDLDKAIDLIEIETAITMIKFLEDR